MKNMSDSIEHNPLLSQYDEDDMSEPLTHPRGAMKSKPSFSRVTKSPFTTIFLAVAISSIAAAVITLTIHRILLSRPIAQSAPAPKSLPLLDVPPLGDVQRALLADTNFMHLDANSTSDAWSSLFPKGKGYVSLASIEAAGPVPNFISDMSSDGSGRLCVAAFHQLHCLYLIYQDYTAALAGEPFHGRGHTKHCIEYLRAGIICAADSNLEPFRSRFEGQAPGNGVDGFGSNHQCRNFDHVYDWAERFRYNDDEDAENFEG